MVHEGIGHREEDIRILPEVQVVKIGGQSIMDRGRQAVYPLLEEIVAGRARHPLIVGAGGGTRSRHAYSIAIDLDMPTGIIAKLGGSVSRQNARMLALLLAKHGGVHIAHDQFELIPLVLAAGGIPVISGMPPYELWERPPAKGRVPDSRTDVGIYLTGEVLGAKGVILVKDEDGLYTDDPKKNARAKFIERISVRDLLALDLQDLIVERKVLELMLAARHVHQIQIINGLKPHNLTKALDGAQVGTVIFTDA